MAATATLYHAQLTGWERIKEFFNAKFINILALSLFLLLAVFLLFPIFAVLVKSFQGPEGFTLAHYENFFTHAYFFQSLYNTLLLGLINTIICVGVGFCFAYMTTRGPMALRKPLKIVAMIPLIAPPYLFALSLIILFGRVGLITKTFGVNWEIYGFDGVVIAQTLAFIPLAFLMLENNIKSLNPNLEESAYDMGATEGTIIRTITLPLLAPGLLKAALLVFVMTIAEFGNAAVLGGRVPFLAPDTYTMIVGEADFSMGSVLSVMLIMPCIMIFIAHNYLLKGKKFTTIEGKPIASEPRKMSPFVKVPFITVTFLFGFTIFICFAVVILAAFVNILGVRNEFVMRHIMDFRSNMAIWNSIRVSFIAALVGGIIGTLLSYVIVRGKFVGRNLIEMISLSGFALPGTVIGVGYLIAFASPPMKLTGGIMILALNCVFRFLAVGVEAGITKLHQINIEIEEASWDMGATFFTTFRRIVLPIMFPAFIAGFIYTFMTAMVSLSAIVFLVSPGYELAAVTIFDAAAYGKIGLASATTLKMIMVVILCMIVLNLLTKFTNLDIERKGGAA
ncbi:MAG: iron ABC transporter permease [Deltaproteobacteria bacterium]|nr:iron ABC transporter permease [Deltaproteobacteria bacterium]MBW2594559.1 iron ABC transporter permease [Deltaproteobacteria bacterium]MBW2649609.1 iron ABC transporter permease [Deltaproteobacteria bacterium]